jgi:hypothetical protein
MGQAERGALLAKFPEQRQAIPCHAAVANPEKSEQLVDIVKWVVCNGCEGIMRRVAEIQGARSLEFGESTEPGYRSTFQADLREENGVR